MMGSCQLKFHGSAASRLSSCSRDRSTEGDGAVALRGPSCPGGGCWRGGARRCAQSSPSTASSSSRLRYSNRFRSRSLDTASIDSTDPNGFRTTLSRTLRRYCCALRWSGSLCCISAKEGNACTHRAESTALEARILTGTTRSWLSTWVLSAALGRSTALLSVTRLGSELGSELGPVGGILVAERMPRRWRARAASLNWNASNFVLSSSPSLGPIDSRSLHQRDRQWYNESVGQRVNHGSLTTTATRRGAVQFLHLCAKLKKVTMQCAHLRGADRCLS